MEGLEAPEGLRRAEEGKKKRKTPDTDNDIELNCICVTEKIY